MQANTNREKAEVQRIMWSPYPDHYLTLWAMPTEDKGKIQGKSNTKPCSKGSDASSRRRQIQWWQISRDFKVDTTQLSKHSNSRPRGKTSEVLATHKLNLGNQSIKRLSIPVSSVPFLTGLVELRMPQNKLKHLPNSLFMLTQLEILNLENNYLEETNMSDHLWRNLVHLRVLFLAGNQFRQLPPSLGRIPRLFYLDVSDNPLLTHLPVELLVSPSLGTLAANRCSTELADCILGDSGGYGQEDMPDGDRKHLPLLEMAPGSPKDSRRALVPSLSGICVRQIYTAINKCLEDEKKAATQEKGSESGDILYGDKCAKQRLIATACERIRRSPDDYVVSDLLVNALDSAENLALCSVCDAPVFYSSFSIVRAIDNWGLPISFHCCSSQCRSEAITMPITREAGSLPLV